MLEQVDNWQEYLALVNMILFCTGVPGHYPVSETTSSLTLTFWYTLQVSEGILLTLFMMIFLANLHPPVYYLTVQKSACELATLSCPNVA